MNSVAPIMVLTSDSVDVLRGVATGTGLEAIWNRSLPELTLDLGLKYVQTSHRVDLTIGLLSSSEGLSAKALDAENAERLLRALPGLTAASATDERLWVTLALGAYGSYVRDRWPAKAGPTKEHLLSHVFAATARGRERDHAIARLWWTGHYVRRHVPEAISATLGALFANSDLPVQLLGRPNLANVSPVAKAALTVFRKYFADAKTPYDRNGVRTLLEEVDLLAGRQAIGALPPDEVRALVEEHFIKCLKVNAAA